MITLDNVKQVFLMGGLAYPYPRLGKISINGGRGEVATKDAIKYAQQVLKARKAQQ